MNFARLAGLNKVGLHSAVPAEAGFVERSTRCCPVLDFEDFVETDSAGLAGCPAIGSAALETAVLMTGSVRKVPHKADNPGCLGCRIEDC